MNAGTINKALVTFTGGFASCIHEQHTALPDVEEFEYMSTAENMLYALGAFSTKLLDFFEKGFNPNDNRLKPSDTEPPAYVFSLITSQHSFDLDGIMRAYSQRKIADSLNATPYQLSVKAGLDFADQLGYQILTPVINIGMINPATIFTYFQKAMGIRIVPYAPVAFVGIPYSAIGYQNSFLALAHELGHYVYRARKLKAGPRYVPAQVGQWYSSWYEEIFADVFGTLFAGPRLARGFQDLSMQSNSRWFTRDNGRHPVPALRPYVYIDTLRALATKWGLPLDNVTAGLEERWESQTRKVTAVKLPGIRAKVNLAGARDKISSEVISKILDDLDALVQEVGLANYKNSLFRTWWGPLDSWDTILNNWEDLRPPTGLGTNLIEVPELLSDGIGKIFVTAPPGSSAKPASFKLGDTNSDYDTLFNTLSGTNVVPEEWLKLVTFGDWIEKGPGGGHGHT